MLYKLSYLNLVAAVGYLLAYLRGGTVNSTLGILVIIVFSWLGLRSFELDKYKWNGWHYLTGLWSFYYAGTLVYSTFYLVKTAVYYHFITDNTLIYLLLTFLFCGSVMWYFVLYFLRNYKEVKF
jgi:hypothetical protein